MNKKAVMVFALLFICLMMVYAMPSKAIVLPVNTLAQDSYNWCTFASVQAIENYYGIGVSQCADVNWRAATMRAAYIWGNYGYYYNGHYANCCDYAGYPYPAIPGEYWQCDTGNVFTGTGSVAAVMSHHGTGTSYSSTPLANATAVQTEMYAGRPFMMGVGRQPDPDFRHAIVAYGISGLGSGDQPMPGSPTWSNVLVHVMDPQIGSGTADVYVGSVFFDVNEYPYWYETLKTTTPVYIPIVAIKVNGTTRSGTIYWNHSSPISVAANVTQGGFGGTQADWWIAALYHGVLYYYNASNGGWYTPAVPTWQKPLANSTATFWTTPIPAGDSITFYWITDLAQNGSLDYPMYSTYLTVIGY